VPDMLVANEMPQYIRDFAGQVGNFSVALAPMMWEGAGIGTIDIIRTPPRPYSEKELALLKTFADQAVIAIQNARLFNETKEALEQQTATSEVLRVISSSVADTAPVFEKILESCSHLFESSEQGIVLMGDDGRLHLGAHRGSVRDKLEAMFPINGSDEPVARAMAEQRVLHYADVLRDAEPASLSRVVAERLDVGSYTQVFAPMRWEGKGAGFLYVTRFPVAPFTDKEIGLLKTFADQAAIAIQNARLFHEIEDKSRQLEAANRHKSEFLANMSHELRTPLNAIIGFSDMMALAIHGPMGAPAYEQYAADINGSAKHLLSIINDILDIAKIEAGRLDLIEEETPIARLCEIAVRLMQERAHEQHITLTLEAAEMLPNVMLDQRAMRQVLLNLLSNAIKFTRAGGTVTLRARLSAEDELILEVSDTGIGMREEDLHRVLEPFVQVENELTRRYEGTGLGLSLSKQLIELHGGRIGIVSKPEIGTTVSVHLPASRLRR